LCQFIFLGEKNVAGEIIDVSSFFWAKKCTDYQGSRAPKKYRLPTFAPKKRTDTTVPDSAEVTNPSTWL
jgi:hypothetical protein